MTPRNRAERRALEHPRHARGALTGPQPMKRGRGRPRKDASQINSLPSNTGTSASAGGDATSDESLSDEASETSSISDDVAPDGVEELQPAWRSVFTRQRRRTADRAPKRARTPRAASATSNAAIVAKLAEYWGMVGVALTPLSGFDAYVIQSRAGVLAEAEVAFARQYSPAALRVLQRITKSTGWLDFAMVHVVTLAPIAANHSLIPTTWVLPFAAQYPWIQFAPPQAPQSSQAQSPQAAPQPQPGVQFSPEQIDALTKAAVERAIAQQNGAGSVPPGYNPLDTAPRAEQNPALDYGIRRE